MKLENIYKYIKSIFLILVLLWIFLIPVVYYFTKSWNPIELEVIGKIGDSFGIINSLFSGLALIGVVITLFLQKKAYDLQREEFEQTIELQKKDFEQTIKQFTKATLISAYTKHLDWYFEERKRQLEGSASKLEEDEFKEFFKEITDNFDSYRILIKETSEQFETQQLDKK